MIEGENWIRVVVHGLKQQISGGVLDAFLDEKGNGKEGDKLDKSKKIPCSMSNKTCALLLFTTVLFIARKHTVL